MTLTFQKVLSAPVLGVFDASQGTPAIPPRLKALLGKSYQEVQPDQRLLAMTELEVQTLEFAAPAQFVCAGRFVRVLDGDRTRYFEEVPGPTREPWDWFSKRLSEAVVLKHDALTDI